MRPPVKQKWAKGECVCGFPSGQNRDNCERCELVDEINRLRRRAESDDESPSFNEKLIQYLYCRLRQSSGRYERDDPATLPEWVPSRIRISETIRNVHPFEPGFVSPGEHDCMCGLDGRIFCVAEESQKARVIIPVTACEIVAFEVNGKRAVKLFEFGIQ